ncbi:MAG: response regulator [Candidatus Paceibacterota bacterium]
MKVLLIEDDKLLRDLLAKKLINNGYVVETAADGEDGMKAMRLNTPNLVLLDIIMPRKSGFEVMKEMRADEMLKDIPIIIVSNSGQPVELDKAKEMGVIDWIIKTEFNPQEVLQKVKKIEQELFKN